MIETDDKMRRVTDEVKAGIIEGLFLGFVFALMLYLGSSRSSAEAEAKGVSPYLLRYLALYSLGQALPVLLIIIIGVSLIAAAFRKNERVLREAMRLIGILVGITVVIRIVAP